jgi:hypothetical protein
MTASIFRSSRKGEKKVDAIVSQILKQRSFYPLYPGNASIEFSQMESLTFEASPDVLILPSDFSHFAKVINYYF